MVALPEAPPEKMRIRRNSEAPPQNQNCFALAPPVEPVPGTKIRAVRMKRLVRTGSSRLLAGQIKILTVKAACRCLSAVPAEREGRRPVQTAKGNCIRSISVGQKVMGTRPPTPGSCLAAPRQARPVGGRAAIHNRIFTE